VADGRTRWVAKGLHAERRVTSIRALVPGHSEEELPVRSMAVSGAHTGARPVRAGRRAPGVVSESASSIGWCAFIVLKARHVSWVAERTQRGDCVGLEMPLMLMVTALLCHRASLCCIGRPGTASRHSVAQCKSRERSEDSVAPRKHECVSVRCCM